MNDDGTYRRRLTRNTESRDNRPRWSPDGKRIAFVREMIRYAQHTKELFIMNADGKVLQRLTDNNAREGYPSWSPDGKRIVFQSDRNRKGKSDIYIMNLETLDVTQLTGIEEIEGELGSAVPDWSPDGTQIVYEKFINNLVRRPGFAAGFAHKNIYLMSANGENQHPLFPDPKAGAEAVSMKFFPRWSSDGQRIVFLDLKWRGKEQSRQFTVMRNGGGEQIITEIDERFGANNWRAAVAEWMNNDRALLIALKQMDNPNAKMYNLYRYEFKTGNIKQLTRDIRDEKSPDWIEGPLSVSPQGKLATLWGEKKQNLSQ